MCPCNSYIGMDSSVFSRKTNFDFFFFLQVQQGGICVFCFFKFICMFVYEKAIDINKKKVKKKNIMRIKVKKSREKMFKLLKTMIN